nr:MAG TPA: hypothetical protein [Caudoviricetes sp.]
MLFHYIYILQVQMFFLHHSLLNNRIFYFHQKTLKLLAFRRFLSM